MAEAEVSSRERSEEARRIAVKMRSRLNRINGERLDPEVAAALDDAYFGLGDLKHACIDHLAKEGSLNASKSAPSGDIDE